MTIKDYPLLDSFIEVEKFPELEHIHNGQLFALSLSTRTTPYTHGLHRFPAKFVPHIPRWAIASLSNSSGTVLDPFMGSGTTLVEGLLTDRNVIGLDIDPLARLIARAKTQTISVERLVDMRRQIRELLAVERSPSLSSPMPDVKNFEHWFLRSQWADLQRVLNAIDGVAKSRSELEFLLVIFSSIIRRVSNADDQSQKTYVSGTNPKVVPDVTTTFWKHYRRAEKGMMELVEARDCRAKVSVPEAGDATQIALESDSVDLIVTSPPYLDSVDYMYNMMLEYFWLGPRLEVPDRVTFNQMRRIGIGAKNPLDRLELPRALETSFDAEMMDPARRASARNYFNLMDLHFREAARVMKCGSRYVLVVGNSRSSSGTIPLHDALLRIAASHGLSLEKYFGYRIRRHYMKFPRAGRGGIILVDWVLVLRKTNDASFMPSLPIDNFTLEPTEVAF